MATRYQIVQFGADDTGLTPTVDAFVRISDGQAVTPQPSSFSHRGRGTYRVGYDAAGASHAVSAGDGYLLILDGGASIADRNLRYAACTFAHEDPNLDVPVSAAVSAATDAETAATAAETAATTAATQATTAATQATTAATQATTAATQATAAASAATTAATEAAIASIYAQRISRLKEGRWTLHTSGAYSGQVVQYDADGTTILQRWALKDPDGTDTTGPLIFDRIPQLPVP